jgi:hypothetical protein
MKRLILATTVILGLGSSAWAETSSSHMLHCTGSLLNGTTAKSSNLEINIWLASDGSWLDVGDGALYQRENAGTTGKWRFKPTKSKTYTFFDFNPDFLSVTASMFGMHIVSASCIPISNPFK